MLFQRRRMAKFGRAILANFVSHSKMHLFMNLQIAWIVKRFLAHLAKRTLVRSPMFMAVSSVHAAIPEHLVAAWRVTAIHIVGFVFFIILILFKFLPFVELITSMLGYLMLS